MRKIAKVALAALLVVLAVLAVTSAIGHVRLGGGALTAQTDAVVARSRDVAERARPEYQELALATLPKNPINGDYVVLDLLLDEARIVEPPATSDDADGSIVFALDFNGGDAALTAVGTLRLAKEDNALVVTGGSGTEADHLVTPEPVEIPAGEVGDILIRAKVSKGEFFRLGWVGDDSNRAFGRQGHWRHRLDVRVRDNEGFHTYVINGRNVLKRGVRPGGSISTLMLLPSDAPDARTEIEFIRFLSRAARFSLQPNGVDYETLGGEQRRMLYMNPDQTLEFDVAVPANGPRLQLGIGTLYEGRALRFEAYLRDAEGGETALLDATADGSRWQDQRIDLAPWAGRPVTLGLRVSGGADNVGMWSSPRIVSAPARRFNVVVMLEDAQRADYLSVYGHPHPTTPFKERLMAERGVVFEQALSQATQTRPSVSSFMTSLYPTASGVWSFSDVLSDRHLTLAEIMRHQGYATAAFVQNGNAGPFAGMHQGFDQFLDPFAVGSETATVFGGPPVEAWLRGHADENFFLYLHVIDPHGPYEAPEPVRARYLPRIAPDSPRVPRASEMDPEWITDPSVDSRRRLYEAEIEANDREVGRFFALLDQLGLAENTLVIMISDHGEFMGERGLYGQRLWLHRPPGLMATTHVPFMVVYPERFRDSKRIAAPVQLLDLMPTILELAEVDTEPLLLQGDSLVDLIEGRDLERWRDRVVVSEEPTAMRKGDPCACGSLYFRNWHVISSRQFLPPTLPQHLQTFAATFAYAVHPGGRGEAMDVTFLPDLLLRVRQQRTLSALRRANEETFAKITAGHAGGRTIDPDTLEKLKGLGYVN